MEGAGARPASTLCAKACPDMAGLPAGNLKYMRTFASAD